MCVSNAAEVHSWTNWKAKSLALSKWNFSWIDLPWRALTSDFPFQVTL